MMHNRGETNLQASFRAVRFLTLRTRILCAATLSTDAFALTSSHGSVNVDLEDCGYVVEVLSKLFGCCEGIQRVVVEESSDDAVVWWQ